MRKWMILVAAILLVGIATLIFGRPTSIPQKQASKELVVYAYSSFVASWGVGPILQKQFEALTGAKLKLVDVGDTSLMISRMEKEGVRSADVWMGMDRSMAKEAAVRFKWLNPQAPSFEFARDFPASEFQIMGLTAFDWSPLAFIYSTKRVKNPSLQDIFGGHYKRQVTAPDPGLSPLGLELVRWLADQNDGQAPIENLGKLRNAKFLFGRSWSQSYGLFQKGEALFSWSFLTSAAFHWIEEKDESYQPLIMEEGHPVIVEYLGVPEDSQNIDLAKVFVDLILSVDFQKQIMAKNYMFPVRAGVSVGSRFEDLPRVKIVTPLIEADAALALWNKVK